jgi:endo-1,4-beta-xylanase
MLTRKEILAGAAAAAIVPGVPRPAPAPAGLPRPAAPPAALPRAATPPVNRRAALAAALQRGDSLAAHAARLGILFGTSVTMLALDRDLPYAQAVANECSILVPEYVLKPDFTRAKPEGFTFVAADRVAEFAAAHGMAFRGHTLVWGETIPAWLPSTITDTGAIRDEMLLEVTEPCRHFRGRVDSWDVVNEVINVPDGQPGGLRKTFWQQKLGPDYIPLALTAARQTDPDAVLVLNEFGIEADGPDYDAKRKALLDLLRSLRRNNVPIDALGLQAHLSDPGKAPINPAVLDRFLGNVSELGLKILVTELDVNDKRMPTDINARDGTVAQVASDFLTTVLRHPGVTSVIAWGLSDKYSWIGHSRWFRRDDGMSARATLLDQDFARKPSYGAVRAAFDGATPRPAQINAR